MTRTTDQAIVDLLSTAHTALISDVCDNLGLASPMLPSRIQRTAGGARACIAGQAFPCVVEPADHFVDLDVLLAMIEAIPAGAVVVVAAPHGYDAAMWGGLMSAGAQARAAVGAVVSGPIRDADQIDDLGFPVFGDGRTALDIRRRGQMRAYGVPAVIDGLTVNPGDVVVGDGNGVAVVPYAHAEAVSVEIGSMLEPEEATFEGLRRGEQPQALYRRYAAF